MQCCITTTSDAVAAVVYNVVKISLCLNLYSIPILQCPQRYITLPRGEYIPQCIETHALRSCELWHEIYSQFIHAKLHVHRQACGAIKLDFFPVFSN